MAKAHSFLAVMCPRLSKSALEGISIVEVNRLPRQLPLDDDAVRIAVKSASINFPELLMMQGKYQYKPPVPFVLCSEGAGIISEVGKTVKRFKVGDRVLFTSGTHGAAAEEVVMQADSGNLHPLPKPLSFSQGAGFLMGYTTAYHGLVHRGQVKPGEWLLVTGAGGGMGVAAVQLGKALGAKVIAAASSDEKLEVCKQLGADAVVNYSDPKSLKEKVESITGGELCDVIYEVVGGDVFDNCVRCVANRGNARLLVIGFAGGTIPKLPVNMALIKGFSLVGVRMGAQMGLEPELMATMTHELLKLGEQGKLKPHVSAEFPPDRAKDAFALMEQRKVIGKACIVFGSGAGSKL